MTKKKKKGKAGRPSIFTAELLEKLDYAFLAGASDYEACLWANIHPRSLWNYEEKNPEYILHKEKLRSANNLRARLIITEALKSPDFTIQLETAKWYAERKIKDEYGTRFVATPDNAASQERDTLNTALDGILEIINADRKVSSSNPNPSRKPVQDRSEAGEDNGGAS